MRFLLFLKKRFRFAVDLNELFFLFKFKACGGETHVSPSFVRIVFMAATKFG